MNKKIEEFKKSTIFKKKEILLIVISGIIDKSEGIKELYDTINNINFKEESENILYEIEKEYVDIYKFLQEAIEYSKKLFLKESEEKIKSINNKLVDLRLQESNEKEKELKDLEVLFNC